LVIQQFCPTIPIFSSFQTLSKEGGPQSIYTSRVTSDDLTQLERVQHTACLFQEYVSKSIELRLTVVGRKIFCAEIDSQRSPKSSVDWRTSYDDLKYAVHKLPKSVAQKCLDLVDRLGLVFAAVDFILTPDGRYVFLEVNPNGQWGWIEDETGLPISSAIIELLIAGKVRMNKS